MTDRYAVLGNPVIQSKSPTIHLAFAKQTNQPIDYTAIEVPLGDFKDQVQLFQTNGGKGFNITVPFKVQAFELAQQHSDRALLAKSVNTIKILADGTLFGDNTDGLGFVTDIQQQHHYHLKNKRVLILGSGGAIRGILPSILAQQPYDVTLTNRTLTHAQNLANEFCQLGNIQVMPMAHLNQAPAYDLIIQGASVVDETYLGLLTDNILTKNTFCYDLKYGQEPTPFLKWAKEKGALKIADGIGMLVEQAAEAFYIWRGVRPTTQGIIFSLRLNR